MKRILFVDEKRDYRRYFENSPEGKAECAKFLFRRYYLPWNRHHKYNSTGMEWFVTTRAIKLGIEFLNMDADFFHYRVLLVDQED